MLVSLSFANILQYGHLIIVTSTRRNVFFFLFLLFIFLIAFGAFIISRGHRVNSSEG